MTNNDIIIGIDLGGTKIMTGAINESGEVLSRPVKTDTHGHESAANIVKRIVGSVEKIVGDLGVTVRELRGIGIGSTGPVDSNNGQILECPQLPNMHFFNLRDEIENHFGVSTLMNNDANCFVLAESVFGIGKKAGSVLGFTLGTGIGSAIVTDKRIWDGATGSAAEIWLSPYKDGSIEDYVSGAGVSGIYRSMTGNKKSSREIFCLAQKGDDDALKTWDAFGAHLAVALAWGINFLDPELVVLGGSVSKAYPFFNHSMRKDIQKFICSRPLKETSIVLGGLGDHAGFIGAACLLLDEKSRRALR